MDAHSYAEEWYVEDAVVSGARTRGAALRPAQPSASVTSVLRMLAVSNSATAVVQAGADSGVSGLYLLAGMTPKGVLTSIEPEAEADQVARESFRAAGVTARVRSINGDPLDVFSRLADHAYDMVVAGDGVGDLAELLVQARRLLRPGGVAVFMRVFGPAEGVIDATVRDPEATAARRFLNEVSEDPTVLASLLPIDGGLLVIQLRE
mgnify:FL=1